MSKWEYTDVEIIREQHAKMILKAKVYGKDWMSKTEYFAYLKREHNKLYQAAMRLLSADEALEGQSGPSVPESVIAFGDLRPERPVSKRWRRDVLVRPGR